MQCYYSESPAGTRMNIHEFQSSRWLSVLSMLEDMPDVLEQDDAGLSDMVITR